MEQRVILSGDEYTIKYRHLPEVKYWPYNCQEHSVTGTATLYLYDLTEAFHICISQLLPVRLD